MPKDRIYSLLESIVGTGNVSNEPYTLECYACDSTTNLPSLPNYVVLATTVKQIQALVRLANKEKIPIVPAVGMSNTGGLTIPVEGGISLDLHKMDKIVEINEDIGYAIVEPGVTIGQLDTELKKRGYWVSLPVGPQALQVYCLDIYCMAMGILAENLASTLSKSPARNLSYLMENSLD